MLSRAVAFILSSRNHGAKSQEVTEAPRDGDGVPSAVTRQLEVPRDAVPGPTPPRLGTGIASTQFPFIYVYYIYIYIYVCVCVYAWWGMAEELVGSCH